MAIAEMTHIRLIGLKKSESKIIDRLIERGLFEVRSTDDTSFELERGEATLFRELKLKQSRVAFAIGFIEKCYGEMSAELEAMEKRGETPRYTLAKRKFGTVPTVITQADFSDARAREYELLNVADELQKISFDIIDSRTRKAELNNQVRAYAPYATLPIKLSELKRTGGVCVYAFITPATVDPSERLDELRAAYEVRNTEYGTLAVVVCRTETENDVEKTMSAMGFSRCAYGDDCTAEQKIDALEGESADISKHIFELNKKALDYLKYYDVLKILYDVIETEVERAEADERFLKTDSTFILEGWLPTKEVKATVDSLRKSCPEVFVQTLAPEEKDEPPTLVLNNKVVEPYEQITNMYSPPKYRELDPNPIMSIFFFIFFGLMIGDAGYGVLLAVAGFVIGLSKKFGKGVKQLALLVGMGGISAIVWGVLFGGYISIDFGVDVAVWFNPINDPMTLLIVCIIFGCVQLCLGYVIKFIRLCMAKKPFSAIFDAGSIILLFGALACLASTMLIDGAPSWLTTVAIVLAVTGLALIIIFGGRENKKPIAKIFGGFKGVYGLVNLLSDILSYSRLFGLALATVAIGMAFNTLGNIIFAIPIAGYPIGIIILVILHVFNIAIGVLGAYVHNARLQFLEFYGKFYDGGGRLFEPLGSRTRYTVIDRGEHAHKKGQKAAAKASADNIG